MAVAKLDQGEFSISEEHISVQNPSISFEPGTGDSVTMTLTMTFTPRETGSVNQLSYDCGVFNFQSTNIASGNVAVDFIGETVVLNIGLVTEVEKGRYGN